MININSKPTNAFKNIDDFYYDIFLEELGVDRM